MEELEARRIRPSLSAMKVFEAALLRKIPSLASTAGHHRARADDTAVLPKWSAPLSRPAQHKHHVGLCIMAVLVLIRSPAVTLSPASFRMSSSQKPQGGTYVQVGSLASGLPRMMADVATNMPVLILAGFAMLGVQVTCPDDPLLALRS